MVVSVSALSVFSAAYFVKYLRSSLNPHPLSALSIETDLPSIGLKDDSTVDAFSDGYDKLNFLSRSEGGDTFTDLTLTGSNEDVKLSPASGTLFHGDAADPANAVFTVMSTGGQASLTLRLLTFEGFKTKFGVIRAQNARVTLTMVNFNLNVASSYGGSVLSLLDGSIATLSHCDLIDNEGFEGGRWGSILVGGGASSGATATFIAVPASSDPAPGSTLTMTGCRLNSGGLTLTNHRDLCVLDKSTSVSDVKPQISVSTCSEGHARETSSAPKEILAIRTETSNNPDLESAGFTSESINNGGKIRSWTCSPCELGYYRDDSVDNCRMCPTGTYGTGTALTSSDDCGRCPLGESTAGSIATSVSDCTMCLAGTASKNPESGCEDCLAGSYSDSDGSQTCTECEVGKSSSESAATSCTNCEAGKYSKETRSTQCSDCPSGRYGNSEGAVNPVNDCVQCQPGKYSTGGGTECASCDVGSVAEKTGSVKCDMCRAGMIPNTQNTTCLTCEVGTYAARGETECSACAANEVAPKAGSAKCEMCEDDEYVGGPINQDCLGIEVSLALGRRGEKKVITLTLTASLHR